jgi:hypothetical protein
LKVGEGLEGWRDGLAKSRFRQSLGGRIFRSYFGVVNDGIGNDGRDLVFSLDGRHRDDEQVAPGATDLKLRIGRC